MRKIVAAFDHAGVDLKDVVIRTIKECGYDVIDVGTDSTASADFPDYAYIGAEKILNKEADKGIFVCGSGVGMCLASNKIKGIYAAVCHDTYSARQAVEHDDINVLCLGSRVIGSELARELICAFLAAEFNHKPNQERRMEKVRMIENGTFELKNNSHRLLENGQSVWLDNIRRGLLENGKIAHDIAQGSIRGITSNPSIYKKAISDSKDYENALTPMALADVSPDEIFIHLVVEDIRHAADLFRNLYISSRGDDGFVSLEVNPTYAHDMEKTIAEAKSLWKSVNRPNLMIKIPVTEEIYPAITELTGAGINLNLTLLFSPERYKKAAEAYIEGLKRRVEQGEPIDKIRSAASVFVSRIDTKADVLLSEKGLSCREMLGKTAIRNSQLIYNLNLDIFNSGGFAELEKLGGHAQRILWASTSIKDPQYSRLHYVDPLIGENTINAMTPETLEALNNSGPVHKTLPVPNEEISEFFEKLRFMGIDIENIYNDLEEEGIISFENDYRDTLDLIRARCRMIKSDAQNLQDDIREYYSKFDRESVMRRIFTKDPTVWTFDTQSFAEIRNRLGWLDAFKNISESIPDFLSLRNRLKKEGITGILLLGMGGSSLAPEVMAEIFDDTADIKLRIVDSTDPLQILEARKNHDPKDTFFIVSSKSGGTAETAAFLDYFFTQAADVLGSEAGSHFAAITDPGTPLEKKAKDLGFRNVFLSDFTVGGRFSALSHYGMIPAALMGLDTDIISEKVSRMMKSCSASLPVCRNEGAALGIFIGTAALRGIDKLTILTDPEFASFGSWLEQLIAESSGKEGKGIVPVDLEPEINLYANDRCFVYINLNNSREEEITRIREQRHPVFEISVSDRYDLFSEFYRWEIAAAAACSILGVNAFDQPNVQDSKARTSSKIAGYRENGKFDDLMPVWSDEETEVWAPEGFDIKGCTSYNDFITRFISEARSGEDYIAINAYLPRNPEMTRLLQNLRGLILNSTGCATTLGFGPRFLHSTGQLHKGGKNNGMFIQIIADHTEVCMIPNEDLSFNCLERAQALGDIESLTANGRRVLRIRFKNGFPGQE